MSRRDSGGGQSLMPIFLILGLVLGIPAVIVMGVIIILAIMGFFVTRAVVDVHDKVQDAHAQHQEAHRQHMENMQKKFPNGLGNPKDQAPKVFVPPVAPAGVPGKTMYDLIPLIDVQKDANEKHKFEIVNNELRCKEGNFVPRVQIPYQPPQEYDFIVTFSQPQLRNGISMIMPKPGGGSFFWYLGGGGLDYGLHANPNIGGNSPGLVKANVACSTTVQVRRDGVRCLVDGVEKLNIKTNFANLQMDGWRKINDERLLAVACDDPTTFHFIRVVEITGVGKRTR